MDCPTGTQGFLPNTDITSYMLHEMYQYTFIVTFVPSMCTVGTLGRKWDVPTYLLLLSVPSMGCVYTVGILGRIWDVPTDSHT